jgi:peptidoglycan/LPS O-acetylase OafA/YrhL
MTSYNISINFTLQMKVLIEGLRYPHVVETKKVKLRAIQNLRGISILGVLVYHFFPNLARGGYIGVDIFFVISGFLITGKLYESKGRKLTAYLGEFYKRRILRLFPAFNILLVVALIASIFLPTIEKKIDLLRGIIFSSLFLQNFNLYSQVSYFDEEAINKPLLHLWSLSIEEQYYLLFPIILWLALRANRKIRFFLLIVGSLTLFASMVGAISFHSNNPSAVFYLTQFRVWEIFMGGLLVFFLKVKKETKNSFLKLRLLSWTIIFLSMFFLSGQSNPIFVLPSVLATMYIILSSSVSEKKEIITSKFGLLAFFGNISYPLYLIHWFALSYTNILFGQSVPKSVLCTILFLVVFFSFLVYRFVESPIQRKKTPKILGVLIFAWMAILLISVQNLHNLSGQQQKLLQIAVKENAKFVSPNSLNPENSKTGNTDSQTEPDEMTNSETKIAQPKDPIKADNSTKVDAIPKKSNPKIFFGLPESLPLQGDLLHDVFHEFIKTNYFPCPDKKLFNGSLSNGKYQRCYQSRENSPVTIALIGDSHAESLFPGFASQSNQNVGYYIMANNPYLENADFNNIFDFLTRSTSIKSVVISSYWNGRGIKLESLQKTINFLRGLDMNVYVLDDIPDFPFSPELCKGASLFGEYKCTNDVAFWKQSHFEISSILVQLKGVKIIESFNLFCNEEMCSMTDGTSVLYRDFQHLNLPGSQFVVQQIISRFPELK